MTSEVERDNHDTEPAIGVRLQNNRRPFAGRVTYFKVYSGVIKNDDHLLEHQRRPPTSAWPNRRPMGKTISAIPELHAGDIGAVAKLKDTLTGDTLADKSSPIVYPPVQYAGAVDRVSRSRPSRETTKTAWATRSTDSGGRPVASLLPRSADEGVPTRGRGQQHMEVIVSRLKKRYNVDVDAAKRPRFRIAKPFAARPMSRAATRNRPAVTASSATAGFAWSRLPRGAKFEFANEMFGGAIPRNFIPAIEKGIIETAEKGYLAGFPVVDFKVTVYDGSYHDVDSSEMAFKLAARKAFKAAMAAGQTGTARADHERRGPGPRGVRGRPDG